MPLIVQATKLRARRDYSQMSLYLSMVNKIKGLIASLVFLTALCQAQEVIKLENPSFEGEARRGMYTPAINYTSEAIEGWYDCGSDKFPYASPPDLFDANSDYWGIDKVPPRDGETFLSLVVREDESYEFVGQTLNTALEIGKNYQFSIHLRRSKSYKSATQSKMAEQNFLTPCVLRIYGGTTLCEVNQLLAESSPVDNETWQEYSFTFSPEVEVSTVVLAAYFDTSSNTYNNGHLLVDYASDIISITEQSPK